MLLVTNPPTDNKIAAIIFLCSAALALTHMLSYAAGANAESGKGETTIMLPFVLIVCAASISTIISLIAILVNIFQ
jgi:hypothetical protein